MMAYETERLFELLPAILRLRDAEAGRLTKGRVAPGDSREPEDFGPLKTLVSLIAREAQIVEEEIDQLYDDLFIETCAPWVIPYLGDLIGVRGLDEIPEGIDPRGQVADAIPLRQRKGTLAALEHAAAEASNWPVLALEYWRRLVYAQSLRLVHEGWGRTVDLRDGAALARIATPFERDARAPEMRRIAIAAGRWNLPNIGLHVWRLKPYSVTRHRVERVRPNRRDYRLHPLGCDAPLYLSRAGRPALGAAVAETDLPIPIARHALHEDLVRARAEPGGGDGRSAYYGPGRAIRIFAAGEAIPLEDIRAANLSDRAGGGAEPRWNCPPQEGFTLIDPELGRLVLDANRRGPVAVSAWFGRVEDTGGGEHARAGGIGSVEAPAATLSPRADIAAAASDAGGAGVIVLERTGPYSLGGTVAVPAEGVLRLVADEHAFPTVDCAGGVTFTLGAGARLELSGLRLQGGGPVRIEGRGAATWLSDCTLLPGRSLDRRGDPTDPGATALEMRAPGAALVVDRSILGPVQVASDVDARFSDTAIDAGAAENTAYAPLQNALRDVLRLRRCTVIGRVVCGAFGDGSAPDSPVAAGTDPTARFATTDTLFVAAGPVPVRAARRQIGCLRFCYLPEGAETPRRYRCVSAPAPVLASRRYSDADYMLLGRGTPETILRGAQNGGEIGVWNRAVHQARDDNLGRVIDEMLRFGKEAGVFHES